ncbi:uncharacterized protein F5147DRAFT_650452 [Suillus discolor]|uniref:Uncharacterized protein n=1 Tax=Suillus discolor TaxID=1912936 RepID=A0A9P7FDZ8_9AGAM|nr:uncharacterized protein F5147DRAFT_650452 [Suillus discolor]KAG2113525.1 hypothetical protein F5147DRAFT_650452 [Suillus discolor]
MQLTLLASLAADVITYVENVLNDADVTVAKRAREDLADVIGGMAFPATHNSLLKVLNNNLDVNGLTKREGLANVIVDIEDDLDNLNVNVLTKRQYLIGVDVTSFSRLMWDLWSWIFASASSHLLTRSNLIGAHPPISAHLETLRLRRLFGGIHTLHRSRRVAVDALMRSKLRWKLPPKYCVLDYCKEARQWLPNKSQLFPSTSIMSTNVVDVSGEKDTPRPNQSIQATIQKYLVGPEEQRRAYGVLARLLLHVTRTPNSPLDFDPPWEYEGGTDWVKLGQRDTTNNAHSYGRTAPKSGPVGRDWRRCRTMFAIRVGDWISRAERLQPPIERSPHNAYFSDNKAGWWCISSTNTIILDDVGDVVFTALQWLLRACSSEARYQRFFRAIS